MIAALLTLILKIIQSAKNLLSSIAEDSEVGSIGGGSDCEDETVERLLLTSKNLNGAIGYLTSNTTQAFT